MIGTGTTTGTGMVAGSTGTERMTGTGTTTTTGTTTGTGMAVGTGTGTDPETLGKVLRWALSHHEGPLQAGLFFSGRKTPASGPGRSVAVANRRCVTRYPSLGLLKHSACSPELLGLGAAPRCVGGGSPEHDDALPAFPDGWPAGGPDFTLARLKNRLPPPTQPELPFRQFAAGLKEAAKAADSALVALHPARFVRNIQIESMPY